ncbi:MAG: AsmA-like C-terminal region-containing protein [Bacteroidales bacterium]
MGHLFTRDLRLYNTKSFVRISDLLKNDRFREMAPDEVNMNFTVTAGRVMVDPFPVKVHDSRITVSGSHGIDLTMDYLLDMQVAKSDLGSSAQGLDEQHRLVMPPGRGGLAGLGPHQGEGPITGTFRIRRCRPI